MLNYHFLSKTALFIGCSDDDIKKMLDCFGVKEKTFLKGEAIFRIGDTTSDIGMVLSGSVTIERDDIWGNRAIIATVGMGQIFAETYACIPGEVMMVNAVAAESSSILFLNVGRVLTLCPSSCGFHSRLLQNLLSAMAAKNLVLTRKISHITPKSIRDRLLSYFSFQVIKQGCYTFDIPFDRQQLADYLSVERSALSGELSKMKRDGLIEYKKNRFTILYSNLMDE